MIKKFNVTGTCIPDKHYMVDISGKLDKILDLIESGEYFTINKPRQYGKTTTLFLLNNRLKNLPIYLPIKISFEGIGDLVFEHEKTFAKVFLESISKNLFFNHEALALFLEEEKNKVENLSDLSTVITKLIAKSGKKVVLMIDEVDKSSNNQLFLSFLGLLRNKYLLSNEGEDFTFHSVILSGVHDVKSLKVKIRQDEEHKYNSPWNIASDFEVDMSFSISEIETILREYVHYTSISLDIEYFSSKLYFYTSGYPFLVSKLCKIIDEKLMDRTKLKWDKEYIDLAVKELLKENNTNFESIIKNLDNNNALYNFVKRIVLDGESITYIKTDMIVNLGTIYGILKDDNGICKINNRVYEQLIYNHMMMKVIRSDSYLSMSQYNYRSTFIREDETLDLKKVILRFQDFMKHEYSQKRDAFLEEDGRLLFLAFLSPIINGTGFAFKEVRGGEEKRFDIVVTYEKRMYILELKKWYGEEYHKRGIHQLGTYLEQYGLDEGYLIIFDNRKIKGASGKAEEVSLKIENKTKHISIFYC